MPDFMSEDEIRLAVRVLRLSIDVDAGDTLTAEQLRAWLLIRDCYVHDWLSHSGSAEQQTTGQPSLPVVQTKRERSMAKYRR